MWEVWDLVIGNVKIKLDPSSSQHSSIRRVRIGKAQANIWVYFLFHWSRDLVVLELEGIPVMDDLLLCSAGVVTGDVLITSQFRCPGGMCTLMLNLILGPLEISNE